MIKRKETIKTSKSLEEFKRFISYNMVDEVEFEGKVGKFLTDFNKSLDDKRKFSGKISDNEFDIKSKTGFYWPWSKVVFSEGQGINELTINYKFFWLYTGAYLFLLVNILLMSLVSNGIDTTDIIPVGILIAIPLLGRFLQIRLKRLLQ